MQVLLSSEATFVELQSEMDPDHPLLERANTPKSHPPTRSRYQPHFKVSFLNRFIFVYSSKLGDIRLWVSPRIEHLLFL